MNLVEMKESRIGIVAEMRTMNEAAKAEKRNFTDEEKTKFTELETKFNELTTEIENEERGLKLENINTELPKTQESDVTINDENASFRNYLYTAEKRDISVGSNGGALAPQQFVAKVIKAIEKKSPIYAAVTKYRVTHVGSLGIPYEATDASAASWTDEIPSSAITGDSTLAYAKRDLTPYPLVKLIKISDKLMKAGAIPVDELLQNKLAEKIADAFENAIVSGTGSSQPLGVFTASTSGVPTSRDVTTSSATAIDADALIDAVYKLREGYRVGAKWVINPTVLAAIRKLKDTNGQYIFQPSLAAGTPATLCGIPVVESEFAPGTIATGNYVAVLGNFEYYTWAELDAVEIQILRELYAGTNQIGFKGMAYADGAPVLAEAFVRVKMA